MGRDTFRERLEQLYQLPQSEFTKARDALAKQDASRGADIRKLQKPSAPAWAVNQLYWRERGAYEALVASAERLRKAQMASLTGKSADVPAAEAAHANARKSAAERVRTMLEAAGEKATPATMTAINETLDALPTADPPGRLVRPLKPAGFEALSGLLSGRLRAGGATASKPAAVLPFKKPAADQRKDERKEQAAKEKQRKVLMAKARDAAAADRDANVALARARTALAKAERDQESAKRKVVEADDRVEAAQRDVRDADRRASQTAIARATAEKELDGAR